MKITKSKPSHRHHFHEEILGYFDAIFLGSQNDQEGFNQQMFDEDFANIFHHSDRHAGDLFELQTNNEELTQRLLGKVKTRYGPCQVDETVREMVEEIARSLIWSGEAFYFLHDDHEKEETHIASYSSKNIFRFAGLTVQYLPKRFERHLDSEDTALGRELRLLDKSKILYFRLPTAMRRMLAAQNSVLASLDKYDGSTPLQFLPQATHENPNPTSDFDFRVWRDTIDLALYSATKTTGWNGRKYDSKKRSDFFDCHRLIRFRKNQLTLRDQILNQLSGELTRVGQHYRKGFRIRVLTTNILPSVSRLDDLEARLTREEAGFKEVIDYCFGN